MSELADLLELLHDAERPFASLHARYSIWRHRERAHAAFAAQARRDGGTLFGFERSGGQPPQPESQETISVWRLAPDRARVEYSAGDRDGTFGVRVGERWWRWDQRAGAVSNAEDPAVGSDTGEELSVLIHPAPLLGVLRFEPLGRATRAGRDAIVVDAFPRAPARSRSPAHIALHQLGSGAQRYRLEIDAQRGFVLSAHAFTGDTDPFGRIDALEFELDQPLDANLFEFHAPAGEQIAPAGLRRTMLHHASIAQAQAAAPFTVLVPERVPSSWRVHCTYAGPRERPPSPASVHINYRSESGHESLNLSLMPARSENPLSRASGWEEVRAGPYSAHVRGRGGACGPQSQLYLEHDGTRAMMISETLSRDQLIALASMLVPAPPAARL